MPYVSRSGTRLRRSDGYLRRVLSNSEWAIRPADEMTHAKPADVPAADVAQARLHVCNTVAGVRSRGTGRQI